MDRDKRARLEGYLLDWARWVAHWRPKIGFPGRSHVFASGGRGYDSAGEWLAESDNWAMESVDSAIETLTGMQRLVISVEFANRAFGQVASSVRLPTGAREYADLLDGAVDALIPIAIKRGLPL